MTTILNIANCSTQGNTGGTFCNLEPARILYILPVPKGTVVPASALASQAAFTTYIQGALWNNTRTSRFQISPKLVNFKNDTKEPVREDLDGWENTTQWLPYVWSWRFANGFSSATFNVFQVWRNYINQQQDLYDFLFVDANNMWFGTQGIDATGAQGMASVAVSNIEVQDWMPATTKTGNQYLVRLVIQNNADLNANWVAVQSYTQTSTFKALTDVSLFKGTTTTTATHIYVSGKIGGNTIGKQYGSVLANVALTAFVITDLTDGTKIFTQSAIAYDAVNDQYNITGAWGSSATGDTIQVALATPSVMTVTPYFAPIITEGTNVMTFVAP